MVSRPTGIDVDRDHELSYVWLAVCRRFCSLCSWSGGLLGCFDIGISYLCGFMHHSKENRAMKTAKLPVYRCNCVMKVRQANELGIAAQDRILCWGRTGCFLVDASQTQRDMELEPGQDPEVVDAKTLICDGTYPPGALSLPSAFALEARASSGWAPSQPVRS